MQKQRKMVVDSINLIVKLINNIQQQKYAYQHFPTGQKVYFLAQFVHNSLKKQLYSFVS